MINARKDYGDWFRQKWNAAGDRWRGLPEWKRRWFNNILLGCLIEFFVHVGGHNLQLRPIVAIQNWGLDTINRMNASWCAWNGKCTSAVPQFAPPVLLAIDEETWRSPVWDGGEPDRAPRAQLATLIDRAFSSGASQVILDVAIEDRNVRGEGSRARSTREDVNARDDAGFADDLRELLQKPYFGNDRRLILVRGERRPLPTDDLAFLPEQKHAKAVDDVIANSGGRIIAAAPYFEVGSDQMLRDWDLFRVVCDRSEQLKTSGQYRVVPSVQLLVAAKFFKVADVVVAPAAKGNCESFPEQGESGLDASVLTQKADDLQRWMGRDEKTTQNCEPLDSLSQCSGVEQGYWQNVRNAFAGMNIRLGGLPREEGVSNRIVFRYTPDMIDVIPVRDTLSFHQGDDSILKGAVAGRIVVIGQTFAEAGDVYATPLGRMPGAVVLVNAIDSMVQHRFLSPPSTWEILLASFLTTVAVAFISVRTPSVFAATVATLFVICTSGIASFQLFSRGIWLDFSAPLIVIQIEQWLESVLEHVKPHSPEKHQAETKDRH
jgi:hypothetical protein